MHLENMGTVCPYSAQDLSEEVGKRVELLRSFEQYKRPPGHMIDVGCGRGLLLEAARVAGWEPFGLDSSITAVEQARSDFRLPVSNEPLENLIATQPFDLCVAWHVFEHCLSPRNFLAHLHRLLAKNGVLALQVPSFSCLAEFVARNRLSSLVNKVHNLYLTTATLGRLLTGAGFHVLDLIEGHDLMLTAFAQKRT
jgi:2-polyprenyl-3-methyl-5-hydroxy-6-metoxy-1,4-benzoquinol methylase